MPVKEAREDIKSFSLPVWTWIAPFFIFLAGAFVSLFFSPLGCSPLFYLPIPLGIILIQWWGPRILPGLFANSIIVTLISSDINDFFQLLVQTSHISICAFASWYLFSYRLKGQAWLPNIKAILYFLIFGILIPITINSAVVFLTSPPPNALEHSIMIWTSDFTSTFSLSLPVLFFLTPVLEKWGLTLQQGSEYVRPSVTFRLLRPHRLEIALSTLALLVLSITLPLERYWFIYGVFTVYISLRWGFNNAILANLLIFILTYVLPFAFNNTDLSWTLESNQINVHMGMCLLSVTACITGRVISDLKISEQKVNKQYLEIERTNRELDRFVYSASHDLSAPLKSLLGLINLSRIEKNSQALIDYINKMGISIHKLQDFIQEILDYSRNSRTHVIPEKIKIEELIEEVTDNLKFIDGFDKIEIRTSGIRVPEILGDRIRLKIIFNNLLTNSIKYSRGEEGLRSYVQISSELNHQYVKIIVSDNGQGIHPSSVDKIFNMFYRGSTKSTGSGLGLYIAKEAIEKMNGKIEVSSQYGEGSTFTIYVPMERDENETLLNSSEYYNC